MIQFNYGSFNHHELPAFIRRQHDTGQAIVMAMHPAVDLLEKEPAWNSRPAEMADTPTLCNRLLMHSIADMSRFKNLGLTDNAALFPYGVINYAAGSAAYQQQALSLIAGYGLCLPRKGLMELAESIHRLKQAGKPVRLCLVNAEYLVGESRDLAAELRAVTQRLGVNGLIEVHDDFLPGVGSLQLLSEADLLIFTHQNTDESASETARYGMATQKPIAVTSLAMFNDLDDAIFELDGCSVDDISQGIGRVPHSVREQNVWAARTQQRTDT